MSNLKVTSKKIQNCLIAANDTYIARTIAGKLKLNANGINADINHALNTLAEISDAQFDVINTLGIENHFIKAFKTAKLKTAKRMVQALAVLGGADAAKYLKGSARTFFLVVGSVALASCKTRDGLAFAVTGRGNEHTSDGVDESAARKLHKMGITSPQSLATQYCVACAMGSLLGCMTRGRKNEMPNVDQSHVVTRAIIARIASMTNFEILAVSGETEQE
jgi:hypothetical protein